MERAVPRAGRRLSATTGLSPRAPKPGRVELLNDRFPATSLGLAYGSPGGATIINSVVNVSINLIDHGMTLQEAIDAPRVSVASAFPIITVDPWFPSATVDALRASPLGYTVNLSDVGSVQAVYIEPKTGKQYGAADGRREGTVIGLPQPRGGR